MPTCIGNSGEPSGALGIVCMLILFRAAAEVVFLFLAGFTGPCTLDAGDRGRLAPVRPGACDSSSLKGASTDTSSSMSPVGATIGFRRMRVPDLATNGMDPSGAGASKGDKTGVLLIGLCLLLDLLGSFSEAESSFMSPAFLSLCNALNRTGRARSGG
jgi:hypothetical protein